MRQLLSELFEAFLGGLWQLLGTGAFALLTAFLFGAVANDPDPEIQKAIFVLALLWGALLWGRKDMI